MITKSQETSNAEESPSWPKCRKVGRSLRTPGHAGKSQNKQMYVLHGQQHTGHIIGSGTKSSAAPSLISHSVLATQTPVSFMLILASTHSSLLSMWMTAS